jgi:hypothetical protein
MSGVLIRRIQSSIQEIGHIKTVRDGSDTDISQGMLGNAWSHHKPGKGEGVLSSSLRRDHIPADTFTSDF